MSQPNSPGDPIPATRRVMLAGAGAAALAVLAGCATYDSSAAPAAPAPAPTPVPAGGSTGDSASPDGSGGGAAAKDVLAVTTDIPVGGGKIIDRQQVVITQPTAGTFKCFTAVCTHQGCIVGDVTGGTINCPCHGSKFKVADGSVAKGPAARPLRAVDITVAGTSITLA
jgi:Rieske Fe-S protein